MIGWHLSVGMIILFVVLVRIGWRIVCRPPPSPTSTLRPAVVRLQETVARMTHMTLYAFLVALPLMGWANASSRGWTVTLFGFIPLPSLSPTGSSLGHAFGNIHKNFAIIMLFVVGLHILGALHHLFLARNRGTRTEL